jgi:hypothetical protein
VSDAIHRYEVPVDDRWHDLPLSGSVLHVASRDPRVVEVWALHTSGTEVTRTFRVFGTGQPLPAGPLRHVGTALASGGQLVWHLMELIPD